MVTESFLPRINGVTNSVCRILEHFAASGHRALVVTPGPGPEQYAGHEVVAVPGVPPPGYRSFVVGLPTVRLERLLGGFDPDAVHLASPVALGAAGASTARRLGLPSVAVFQTDVAGFAPVFPGFLGGDELSRMYASLDVFVHTGADETFCQAVQEAMASGVPVVAPAAGGPLDLVEPGRTGLLFAPGSTGELREAVGRLCADAALRADYGARAREAVVGRTWSAVCDELLGHYADVLAARTAVA